MKNLTFLLAICIVGAAKANQKLNCKLPQADVPSEWRTMADRCVEKMKSQVETELSAAMTYLAMGAHFSRDSVDRPGFAKLFFAAADEEREHATKLIGYLLMRGELTTDAKELIRNPLPKRSSWENGVSALKDALKLEASVTAQIRDIIKVCEAPPEVNGTVFNDYHLVDYLTGQFLEEQYKGQRELAAHVSTLGKMTESHGEIGEFLYDKKLLE